MKKIIYVLCFVLVTGLIAYLYFSFTQTRKKDAEFLNIKKNLIVNKFTERSALVVLESQYYNPIKLKVHRNILSDFDLDYIVVGSFSYSIDLSDFNGKDIAITKDSIVLTVPKPEIFSYTVDHNQSRFVGATWRFGINEFNLADSAYAKAQNYLYEYANSPELRNKAEVAGEEAVKKIIKELEISDKSVKVYFQDNFNDEKDK
jgi:hypothetical protein